MREHPSAKRFIPPKGLENPKVLNLAGKTFGRWRVESWDCANPKSRWHCICQCGTRRSVASASLLDGQSRSCGCLSREIARAAGDRTRTHGMGHTTTYHIWTGMLQRCLNPKSKDFYRYGGKGITVCERWRTFVNFLADMGERPTGHSIDRIDNSKGYSPDNCRWADIKTQARNTSQNLVVQIDGDSRCLAEWCERLGISLGTVKGRRSRGWDIVRALTTPPDKRFRHD